MSNMKRIITENGKSSYHIVTSRTPQGAEMYAASVLYEYLYKATNAIVPYYSDIEERRSPEIHVGIQVRGRTPDLSALSDDGFLIETVDSDIVIAGKTPRGTVYGVYAFLEKYIGFGCFTKDVEVFNRVDTLVVEDVSIRENPAFEYREVYFRGAFDPDFCVKNRLNSNIAHIPEEKGGKLKFYNFHHSFQDLVPPDIYFPEHPEYFSEIDGVRTGDNSQLCLSNEEVFEITKQNLRKWIRNNPRCRVFSVSQNDNARYCQCTECQKTDEKYGSPAGSIMKFVNRLAEDIRQEYPDVLLHTFAYWYSRKAPEGILAQDNVIVRLCNAECSWDRGLEEQAECSSDDTAAAFLDNLKKWGSISKHLYIWDYACNFRNYLMPFPNYRSLPLNLQTYHKAGAAGILEQGNFSYGNLSALADLESYLCARLMWDPYQDAEKLIDDFLKAVYGTECYPYIREYVNLLLDSSIGKPLKIYQNTDADYLTHTLLDKAEMLFERALAVCVTEKQKWYLEKEYLSVRFMKSSRMELTDINRNKLIDALYQDIKRFEITEIRERDNLEVSFQNLRSSRYGEGTENQYRLYYIMK